MTTPEDLPEFRGLVAKLGPELRRRRHEARLSQADLAKAAGISRNQIQNIEQNRNNAGGVANPTLASLVEIGRASCRERV